MFVNSIKKTSFILFGIFLVLFIYFNVNYTYAADRCNVNGQQYACSTYAENDQACGNPQNGGCPNAHYTTFCGWECSDDCSVGYVTGNCYFQSGTNEHCWCVGGDVMVRNGCRYWGRECTLISRNPLTYTCTAYYWHYYDCEVWDDCASEDCDSGYWEACVEEHWDAYGLCEGTVVPPSCSCSPSSCSPSCPPGQTDHDTGYGVAGSDSCSYNTGSCNGDGSCETDTDSTTCWYTGGPPVPCTNCTTVTSMDGTATPLGCTIASGNIAGKETNNLLQIYTSFSDTNGIADIKAVQSWLSKTSAPVISKIYDTGAPKLLSNDSFGILVKEVGGVWTDLYVPGVDDNSSTIVWRKAGTVGTGQRAWMRGTGDQYIIGISDVYVTEVGSNVELSYKIQFFNETSGLELYEKAIDGTYNLFIAANDTNGFLPSGGTTIAVPTAWTDSTKDVIIDLTDPVADTLTYSVLTATTFSLSWRFTDSNSSIIRSIGDASIATAGKVNGTIDDTTSGVTNYVLGSGATGVNLYSGSPHLWSVNNLGNRADTIDLKSNEGGSLNFEAYGFDASCNSTHATLNVGLGETWVATKGGLVNTGSGSTIIIPNLTGHTTFSADSYWNSPFGFLKDEADFSSILLSGSTSTLSTLLHSSVTHSVSITQSSDGNNRTNYWYGELLKRVKEKIALSPATFIEMSSSGNKTVSGNASDIVGSGKQCASNKNCVLEISGNLSVLSGFNCDVRVAFLVGGTTTINPDITASAPNYGCLFISKGDVTIAAGTYKSSSSAYPKYDIIEGYILTDGIINIPLTDSSQEIRDGLKVNGSLVAFGTDASTGRSINMLRSLKLLFNNSYPALAVHFDNRYVEFAPIFFGGQKEGFEREVGFKAF
ncbi:hypothetical protein M0R04_03770 [Candidatus Dojkabacteria bacterium]|jgi:hypothetical protein|nr:hypothetical protein [Candidatus Dojkabacteria bacterium]